LSPTQRGPRVRWGSAKSTGRAQTPRVRLSAHPQAGAEQEKKLKGGQIKNIILKRLILSYFIQGRG